MRPRATGSPERAASARAWKTGFCTDGERIAEEGPDSNKQAKKMATAEYAEWEGI
jgi:hypothetical protein